MPGYLKAIISLLVAGTAAAAYYAGIEAREAALALAAAMIVAIWLFPEAGEKKDAAQ
jgi:hypothetical protein